MRAGQCVHRNPTFLAKQTAGISMRADVMKWRLLIALIGLSITDVVSTAQSIDAGKTSPAADVLDADSEVYAGYLGSSGVVRFQLIQGRITLDAPRHRKGAQQSSAGGVYESVSVTAQRGIPSVHYISQTSKQHLVLNVQDANEMRIESWIPQQNSRCILNQPSSGPITIQLQNDSLQDGDLDTQWQGWTLIHVRLNHPQVFDQHFGHLIARMLHGQTLRQLCDATWQAAVDELQQPARVTEKQVQTWIDQLGSDRRRDRIDAQRHLMASGSLVTPTLRWRLAASNHHDPLDQEQQARLRRILSGLRSNAPDRPRSLAKLLVNDPDYWSLVSPSLSHDQRHLVQVRQSEFRGIQAVSGPITRIARQP